MSEMFKVLKEVNGDIVLTRGEYGFQEVINNFSTANYINIVTYNINTYKESKLINKIKDIPISIPVNIVLNIPKKSYGSTDASQQIYWYLKTLEREKFNDINIYFNFSNHAKLIMTDNIAYIGSQNFSDASSNNIELGFVVNDRISVGKIKNEIFDDIKYNSIRYATSDYVITMEDISTHMREVFGVLRYNLFTFVGDPPYTPEYETFNVDNAVFPEDEWVRFKELDESLFEIFDRISKDYNYVFNDNKAESLKKDIKTHLTLFINNLDIFSEYLKAYESRTMDLFYERDNGDTDFTMGIVMQEMHGEKEEKFDYLNQNGEKVLENFKLIEVKIDNLIDLVEEIKYEMIKNTVYENSDLI